MDPKLYPRRVRYAALLTLNIFVFLGNMYSSGIATGFQSLGADMRVPNNKLSDVISWSVLSMGLSNLFWMPLALCIGKRTVVLISLAMFLGGLIWTSVAKDYGSLIGARVFASFGLGSVESIGPSILADMFYEKDYASAMATYALFLSGGSQIGPVIAGYLIEARGWRWFFILCVIIAAVNLVTTFFFLPETLYEPDADEPFTEPEKADAGHLESVPSRPPFDYRTHWRNLFSIGLSKGARKGGILKYFATLFILPLPMLLVPGVLLASMMYGVALGAVVSISTLCPTLLSPPPYLFSSAALGLFTLSSFIGVLIAFPIAGPLTDLLSRVLRKRNNNIHKPEHRIPALIVPFLVSPVGLIVFGYAVSRQMHYAVPAVGQAMTAAALTLVPSVMLSYVVDAYPRTSGEALVLVNASKNVVAFGLSKGSYAWMGMEGVRKMFYEFAGIQWAVLFLGLPLYVFGPWVRRRMEKLGL
ncbi:putative MFS transporter [Aspergillus ambiguus]|uniref:putative MFS transporter n=1 Tax=Aspergillus ambiguus TaxID=176160 RepID=UPI003CCD4ED4